MSKKKNCKGCEEDFPLSEFPNSATAKDGKLGYCSGCWSERMSAARSKRGNGHSKKNGKKSDKGNIIDLANQALAVAGKSKEIITVVASDGDSRTFTGKRARKQALKQAMMWMLEGYRCVMQTETRTIKKEKIEFSLKTVSRG